MLAIVASLTILFYLSAIPVHITFWLQIGAETRHGIGISIFEPRFLLKLPPEKRKNPKPSPKLHPADALSAAKAALHHIRIDRFRLHGSFGTSDAAVTALICGAVSAVSCIAPPNTNLCLQPDFSCSRLQLDLTGMISMRAGHIMTAALLGAFQYGFRRFKAWISIPLKAS